MVHFFRLWLFVKTGMISLLDVGVVDTSDTSNDNEAASHKTTAKFVLFRMIGNDLPPRHKVTVQHISMKIIVCKEKTVEISK